MSADGAKTALAQRLIFFIYGGLTHFVFHRINVHRAFSSGSDTSILNHPLTNIFVPILGGISVSWCMIRLLRQAPQGESVQRWQIVLKGGLYGILATSVVLALFWLAESIVFSARSASTAREMPLRFIFVLMGIGTYGMGTLMKSLPFDFIYGAIAGVYVFRLRSRDVPWPRSTEERGGMAEGSFALSILGLLLVFAPSIGAIFSALAVAFGVRTIKQLRGGPQGQRRLAKAAVILGTLCLAWFLFSVGVFVVSQFR